MFKTTIRLCVLIDLMVSQAQVFHDECYLLSLISNLLFVLFQKKLRNIKKLTNWDRLNV